MSDSFSQDASLLKLFLQELELHLDALSSGLLDFERKGPAPALVESLMRAAHSIKGAARVLHLDPIESVAHALEDCFLASQRGDFEIGKNQFDLYFQAIDALARIAQAGVDSFDASFGREKAFLDSVAQQLRSLLSGDTTEAVVLPKQLPPKEVSEYSRSELPEGSSIRVSAQYLTRVMALAAESLIETGRLDPFSDSLVRVKDNHEHLIGSLSALEQVIPQGGSSEAAHSMLREMREQEVDNLDEIRALREQLYLYSSRNYVLSDQLYQEVLAGRMRPLADILKGFPRLVRDLSHVLGKEIEWQCSGVDTAVDRDSLEKLEAPLTHLVRNACDHGIELPSVRIASGKPSAGHVNLVASHRGGMLVIELRDDGSGVDPERVRSRVIEAGLLKPERAQELPVSELFDFMFLPGFSTSASVSKVSGRGVGLDVVKEVVGTLGGSIEVSSEQLKGTVFTIRLPISRSVERALLVRVGGELYAFPLNQVVSVLDETSDLGAYAHCKHICARDLLGSPSNVPREGSVSHLLLQLNDNGYIFEVDAIVGESNLLVSPLDPRLGKVPGIASASQDEDGSVVLIVDVPDLLYVVERGALPQASTESAAKGTIAGGRRVLVVDDSMTVREAETQILKSLGLEVEVAVDGLDAWEAISIETFDLVITDLDMPRMTGFELLEKVKRDPRYSKIPMIVLSYKDRPEDRKRALALGASHYILKSEFEDGRLQACIHELFDK